MKTFGYFTKPSLKKVSPLRSDLDEIIEKIKDGKIKNQEELPISIKKK